MSWVSSFRGPLIVTLMVHLSQSPLVLARHTEISCTHRSAPLVLRTRHPPKLVGAGGLLEALRPDRRAKERDLPPEGVGQGRAEKDAS